MQSKMANASGNAFGIFLKLLYYLWLPIKIIGVASVVLSLLIVIGIQKLDYSWCISARELIESLTPVTWVGYIILFVVLTAVFSLCSFVYGKWNLKQKSKYLRKQWNEFGLCLPAFVIVNMKVIERTDGCYGSSTSTVVYTIRFTEEPPYTAFLSKGEWVNPAYTLESYRFSIKQLTLDMAEVTLDWEYMP